MKACGGRSRTILAIGFIFGAFNGFGVIVLRIPAFVMTLATGIIVQSAVLEFTQGAPPATCRHQQTDFRPYERPLVQCSHNHLSRGGADCGRGVVQDMSTFGRKVHAIGGNPKCGGDRSDCNRSGSQSLVTPLADPAPHFAALFCSALSALRFSRWGTLTRWIVSRLL